MSQLLHSPHEATIINALQWQDATNNCAPYTIATIISAFSGSFIDGAWLATQMNKPAWRGIVPVIRRIPNWATFPWGMVDVLHEYGFQAHWRINSSTDYLRNSIQRGNVPIPVIVSWRPMWAHVMSLLAWDSAGRWGFANTQINDKNINWITDDYFMSHWKWSVRMLVEVKLV
jgi:hypothetical protein